MNVERDKNGIVDLGAFRKQKEERRDAEMFQHIASQLQPQVFVETEAGEELELKLTLSAIVPDRVFMMLSSVSTEEGQESQLYFMTVMHDGETLSEQMRTMTEEEFNEFQVAVRSMGAEAMAPFMTSAASVEETEQVEDPGII